MFNCPEKLRLHEFERKVYGCNGDAGNGCFLVKGPVHRDLLVIASNGGGWEHTSVHIVDRPDRTPTWDEMCCVKDIFWGKDDVVLQIHPSEADYVDDHKGTLHLWRDTRRKFKSPLAEMVGIGRK